MLCLCGFELYSRWVPLIKVESSEIYLLKLRKICLRFGRCLHFVVKMWF